MGVWLCGDFLCFFASFAALRAAFLAARFSFRRSLQRLIRPTFFVDGD
jgi:hypothetical protein